MDYFKVINERHSIRAYKNKPVESDKLEQILQSVKRTPSAGNLRAYEVYLIRDEKRKGALAVAADHQEFLAEAPVVLIFCAHADRSGRRYGERGKDLYSVQDATIACTYAMLAATALGLSTVWVGAFDEEVVRQVIDAPPILRPVAMLPIGYANETPRLKRRRSLNDLVHQA